MKSAIPHGITAGNFGNVAGIAGIAVQDVTYKPTRTREDTEDEDGVLTAVIFRSPRFQIDVPHKVLDRSGAYSNLHPGSALTASAFPLLSDNVMHGFTEAILAGSTCFVDSVAGRKTSRGVVDENTLTVEFIGFTLE